MKSLDEKVAFLDAKIVGNFEQINEKLDKQLQLEEGLLAIREVVNKNLLVQNKKLSQRINTLERRLVDLERVVTRNNQNSRKCNVEISGIPKSVKHDNLRQTVTKIFTKMSDGTACSADDVIACHRLSEKNATTIVKFTSRELVESIMKNKKRLSKMRTDSDNLGLGKTNLYVNMNLCPQLKEVSYNCRLLKKQKLILNTWESYGAVYISDDEGIRKRVDHVLDLYILFPDFEEFSFHRDFCANVEELEEYIEYDGDSDDGFNT